MPKRSLGTKVFTTVEVSTVMVAPWPASVALKEAVHAGERRSSFASWGREASDASATGFGSVVEGPEKHWRKKVGAAAASKVAAGLAPISTVSRGFIRVLSWMVEPTPFVSLALVASRPRSAGVSCRAADGEKKQTSPRAALHGGGYG
jgi:hypothetical protein